MRLSTIGNKLRVAKGRRIDIDIYTQVALWIIIQKQGYQLVDRFVVQRRLFRNEAKAAKSKSEEERRGFQKNLVSNQVWGNEEEGILRLSLTYSPWILRRLWCHYFLKSNVEEETDILYRGKCVQRTYTYLGFSICQVMCQVLHMYLSHFSWQ